MPEERRIRAPDAARDAEQDQEVLEDFKLVTDPSLAYMSLERQLSELLERVTEITGADTAAILLLDPERDVLVARAARGIEEEVREGVQVPLGRGFAGRIAAERRPIAIEDVGHADILNPILRRTGIRSLLGVPLVVEGRVIGVMHVGTLRGRKFEDEDVRLLQLVADRAGLAIDNAQLSEQRALTEVLQRTLLPEALPQIPGLRFSAKYLPAASGIKLGGDWFDVFELPDGRIAFVVGDVVGRGIAAASVMAEVRSAVRAYTMEGHDPVTVVRRLNDLLIAMGRRRSATLAFMALELETGELLAVSAGHLPAVIRTPSGETRFIGEATGPPLGVLPTANYTGETYTFPLGAALLLYTDGLVERRDEVIDDGLQRLAEAVAGAATQGGMSLADAVLARVRLDTSLEDDVALLAIESRPLSDQLALTLDAQPAVLSSLRRGIGRWLAAHGVAAEARFDVALAVSEASANAIEHAYGPADATFAVECRYSPERVAVTVSDTGTWRPQGKRERGRGMDIMQMLMDDVRIDRTDDGTRVLLTKRLGG